MYEPKKMKMLDLPKMGEIVKAKITDIEVGTKSQYFGLDNVKEGQEGEACIKVTFEYNKMLGNKIFSMPESLSEIHPKSTLGKFFKTYGSFPELGQEINIKINDKGFFDVII